MSTTTSKKPMPSLKRKRKTISTEALVKRTLQDSLTGLPLVFQPTQSHLNPAQWAELNRKSLITDLRTHGALLFRGFPIENATEFQAFASAMLPNLYGNYGDLPKEKERIYKSTPYPADRMILFHNESSHLKQFPEKQLFFCLQPSESGGATPIADGCEVASLLGDTLIAKFRRRKLRYIRHFLPGLDVAWQDFFKTDSREDVEARCMREGMGFEWLAEGGLRIYNQAEAVIDHPYLGKPVFFNQIQLHHPDCLDANVAQAMRDLYGEKRLPRNVTYGDGQPIGQEVVQQIGEAYEHAAKRFLWQKGDVLMLDNLRYSHARDPFIGSRKILVAMADICQLPETSN